MIFQGIEGFTLFQYQTILFQEKVKYAQMCSNPHPGLVTNIEYNRYEHTLI